MKKEPRDTLLEYIYDIDVVEVSSIICKYNKLVIYILVNI